MYYVQFLIFWVSLKRKRERKKMIFVVYNICNIFTITCTWSIFLGPTCFGCDDALLGVLLWKPTFSYTCLWLGKWASCRTCQKGNYMYLFTCDKCHVPLATVCCIIIDRMLLHVLYLLNITDVQCTCTIIICVFDEWLLLYPGHWTCTL